RGSAPAGRSSLRSGLTQIVFPKTLSGDYSFPQEPIPDRTVFPESVLGAAMMGVPLLGALVLWILAMVRERRARARASLILQRPMDEEGMAALAAPPPLGTFTPALRPIGAGLLGLAVGAALLDWFVLRPRGVHVTLTVLGRTLAVPLLLAPFGL